MCVVGTNVWTTFVSSRVREGPFGYRHLKGLGAPDMIGWRVSLMHIWFDVGGNLFYSPFLSSRSQISCQPLQKTISIPAIYFSFMLILEKSRDKYRLRYLISQNKIFTPLYLLNLFIKIFFFQSNNNRNRHTH